MQDKRGMSIRHKVFLGMMLISMIPVILFVYFSQKITYSAMHSQLIDSKAMVMDWLNDRLSLTANLYADQFYGYEVDKDMKESIVAWGAGTELDYIGQDYIRKNFETTLNLDPNIISIEIYNLHTGAGYISTRSSFHPATWGPAKDIWDNRAEGRQTNVVFDTDGNDLLVMHQVNDFSTGKGDAVIIFRLSNYVFSDILDKVQGSTEENALLLNDEDKVIMSNTDTDGDFTIDVLPGLMGKVKSTNTGSLYEDNHYFFYESVLRGKLQVLYIVPNSALVQTIHRTTTLGIIIVSLSVVAALLLSLILSRIISRPIISLSQKMRITNIQNFTDAEEAKERNDEIGYLQKSFGIMIHRNQELIAKEYQSEFEKRNAQISALQAQINPHFMYNTLQVIGGMSLRGKAEDIYPVVTALSDIMRYSFNFSQEMVPLREEIEYLHGYLSIQNHRFNHRIQFTMDISDELMKVYIPKLILQPILENSFEHGLTQKRGKWKICLNAAASSDDCLKISISDNGLGMSQDRLDEMRRQLDMADKNAMSTSAHIGLINVHSRIRLRFGRAYGVMIESEAGEGTMITITTKPVWEADA